MHCHGGLVCLQGQAVLLDRKRCCERVHASDTSRLRTLQRLRVWPNGLRRSASFQTDVERLAPRLRRNPPGAVSPETAPTPGKSPAGARLGTWTVAHQTGPAAWPSPAQLAAAALQPCVSPGTADVQVPMRSTG